MAQTQTAEEVFAAARARTGTDDKLYYRLGEVAALTGFDPAALLKLKAAGTLRPRQIPGYKWDCYPRAQVVALCDPNA